MIRLQMWNRLNTVEQRMRTFYRKPVVITSFGAEKKKEVDELVERWMSGEPMDCFVGVYDEKRVHIIRMNGVAPGDV